MDSGPSNRRFAEDTGATFPLLSDFKRKVSKDYGILNEEASMARRATFVVDKQGIIRHIEEGKTAVDPSGAHTACSRLASGS